MSFGASLAEICARPGQTEITQAEIAEANAADYSVLIGKHELELVEPTTREPRAWRDYSGEWITIAGETRCESLSEALAALKEGL